MASEYEEESVTRNERDMSEAAKRDGKRRVSHRLVAQRMAEMDRRDGLSAGTEDDVEQALYILATAAETMGDIDPYLEAFMENAEGNEADAQRPAA